jgi:hypothetical protein
MPYILLLILTCTTLVSTKPLYMWLGQKYLNLVKEWACEVFGVNGLLFDDGWIKQN